MAIFPAIQRNANEQALSFLDQGHGLFAKNAWYWADSAYVNGRMGNQKQAAAAIKKLKALNAAQELDPGLFVVAYVGVGDNEQAISWLDKALQQHSNVLTVLKVDPIYDPLRPDARFQQVLRQIHLDQ
jgi:tetratricopeptide (TPR) repeat protein